MMDWLTLELCKAYHQDLLREAEQARLFRRVQAGRATKRHLFCQMLSWLGHWLVAWGQWLQQRFAADHPIDRFPVVDQAR